MINDIECNGIFGINENDKTISLSQKGSVLKLLDSFPPKFFTKTSRAPFLRTTFIDENLLDESERRETINRLLGHFFIYLFVLDRTCHQQCMS